MQTQNPAYGTPAVDLTGATWRKSTFSTDTNCALITFHNGIIAVRNSNDPENRTLVYTPAEWDAFVKGAKNGEFDQ